MKRLLETTVTGLVALAIGAGCPRATAADEPQQGAAKRSSITPGVAALAQNLIDTVLEHDIDPPTRQQMILTGIKTVYKAADKPVPERLSSRVSMITTPEQLASLLEEVWPAPEGESVAAKGLEEAFLNGMLSSLSGAAQLMPEKKRKVQEQMRGEPVRRHSHRAGHGRVGKAAGDPRGHRRRAGRSRRREGERPDRADRGRGHEGDDAPGCDRSSQGRRGHERHDQGSSAGFDNRAAVHDPCGQHPRPTIAGWQKRASGEWDYRMGDSQKIAYIKISEMAGSTPHELRKLAARLEGEGLHAAVLDLRGLGSTSEHCALLMADSLLDHGTIGRVRSSHGDTTYQADSEAILRRWPLVVLVDGLTSGAPNGWRRRFRTTSEPSWSDRPRRALR